MGFFRCKTCISTSSIPGGISSSLWQQALHIQSDPSLEDLRRSLPRHPSLRTMPKINRLFLFLAVLVTAVLAAVKHHEVPLIFRRTCPMSRRCLSDTECVPWCGGCRSDGLCNALRMWRPQDTDAMIKKNKALYEQSMKAILQSAHSTEHKQSLRDRLNEHLPKGMQGEEYFP